jgi:hypothetical protein
MDSPSDQNNKWARRPHSATDASSLANDQGNFTKYLHLKSKKSLFQHP